MGFLDLFRNELIEVIDWVDNTTDTVMWKFQDKENNIKHGAKLTVRESQLALFMSEGKFGDMYLPGLHELISKNMPITTTLESWKYGFESPFKVDVYFINTKVFSGLRWGTTSPIMIKDAEFGAVRLKSFGNYAIKISDGKKFLTEFAGTNQLVKVNTIEDTVRQIIMSKFAEVVAESKITVLELASNFSEVSAKLIPWLQLEIDKFGITIENFYIESVTLPEEVEKMLDKKTELNIMKGSLDDFNKMQAGISLEKMAENENSGVAGVGAGVLLTNMMGQNVQQQNTSEDKTKVLELIKQLGELKNQGLLTEEEFNAKKQELLSKL